MTVSSKTAKIIHIIDLKVKNYTFPFKSYSEQEIKVLMFGPENSEQIIFILNHDYIVNGLNEDSGGEIVFTELGLSKLIAEANLVIRRSMNFTQDIKYEPYGAFPSKIHEKSLDILTMQIQELKEKLKLAVLAPENETKPLTTIDILTLKAEVKNLFEQIKNYYNLIENYQKQSLLLFEKMQEETYRAKQEADRAEEIALIDFPVASENIKGIAKFSEGFVLDNGSVSLKKADKNTFGVVKIGKNLSINEGILNAENSYILPLASENVLGGIKVGSGLKISAEGVLSVDFGGTATTEIFTETGEYVIPISGIYEITLIGGGGGGGPSYEKIQKLYYLINGYGGGGGGGETLVFDLEMKKGELASFFVGKGGSGGEANNIYENTKRAVNGGNTSFFYKDLILGAHGGGSGGPHAIPNEKISLPGDCLNLPISSGIKYSKEIKTGGGAGGVSFAYNNLYKTYQIVDFATDSGVNKIFYNISNVANYKKPSPNSGEAGYQNIATTGIGGGKDSLNTDYGVGGNGGIWLKNKDGANGLAGAVIINLKKTLLV